MSHKSIRKLAGFFAFICLFVLASPLSAQISVSLSPDVTSPQLVGTTVTWTATVTDPNPGNHDYRFTANLAGQPTQIRRDYSQLTTFSWTPSVTEGSYTIGVTTRNRTAGASASAIASYTINPRMRNTVNFHQSSPGGAI